MKNILAKTRLEEFQLTAIVSAFTKFFSSEDHLWLFGSRVKLNDHGGDIDLYIETYINNIDDAYNAEKEFLNDVWDKIGEQKIDIVLNMLHSKHEPLAIYTTARKEGVQLV